MKHDPITPPQVPLVDNYGAPELFVTGVSGCGMVHGTVLLTLEGARCDHSKTQPTMERVVAGRLVLTLPAAQSLVAGLNHYLNQNGLSPSQAMMGTATRQ